MQNLFTISPKKTSVQSLSVGETFSVAYHNLFDYPLTPNELMKWKSNKEMILVSPGVEYKNGYFFLKGNSGSTYKRILRSRVSAKKLEIAKKTSKILSILPGILLIAVTGSLAMQNSDDESDIDLMLVTKKGSLWTTRLFVYLLIGLFGIPKRSPMDKVQKDKLCLNMWLDENDMIWRKHNVYSAHEIAQIVPLINKNHTYEKFLLKNRWVLSYWPNSVKIRNPKHETRNKLEFQNFKYLNIVSNLVLRASNLIAFKIQYLYMKKKISREIITETRALFHPQDWGKVVLGRLTS